MKKNNKKQKKFQTLIIFKYNISISRTSLLKIAKAVINSDWITLMN